MDHLQRSRGGRGAREKQTEEKLWRGAVRWWNGGRREGVEEEEEEEERKRSTDDDDDDDDRLFFFLPVLSLSLSLSSLSSSSIRISDAAVHPAHSIAAPFGLVGPALCCFRVCAAAIALGEHLA